jgi:hypothetical protein
MPAADSAGNWFVSPYGKSAWWHLGGWVLYPSGFTEAWPSDLTPPDNFSRRFGYDNSIVYHSFEAARSGAGFPGGGRPYYRPDQGVAVNSKTGSISLVGQSMIPYWETDGGYDCTWSPVVLLDTQIQARWLVKVVVRPKGLAGVPFPWFDGKTYPQYPPLRRGRPRKPPAP